MSTRVTGSRGAVGTRHPSAAARSANCRRGAKSRGAPRKKVQFVPDLERLADSSPPAGVPVAAMRRLPGAGGEWRESAETDRPSLSYLCRPEGAAPGFTCYIRIGGQFAAQRRQIFDRPLYRCSFAGNPNPVRAMSENLHAAGRGRPKPLPDHVLNRPLTRCRRSRQLNPPAHLRDVHEPGPDTNPIEPLCRTDGGHRSSRHPACLSRRRVPRPSPPPAPRLRRSVTDPISPPRAGWPRLRRAVSVPPRRTRRSLHPR